MTWELVADPVPDLAAHLGLRADQVVALAKCCYGLIDAPRQWWLSLQGDLQKAAWRKCKMEPCMMRLWSGGRLVGLLCFHVDDVMIAGNERGDNYQEALQHLKQLYEWGKWEEQGFEMCGCRLEQDADYNITVDQLKYARAAQTITLSARRRKHEHGQLT